MHLKNLKDRWRADGGLEMLALCMTSSCLDFVHPVGKPHSSAHVRYVSGPISQLMVMSITAVDIKHG